MNGYANAEMADMHLIYRLADGNSLEASRLYRERFPNRNVPNRETFQSIHQRLRETGALKRSGGPGMAMTVRTVELEENVLAMVEEDPAPIDVNASVPTDIPQIVPAEELILKEVWSGPTPKMSDIEMDSEKVDEVKQAMANITLPSTAIPEWAMNIPEEDWKQELLERIEKLKRVG